jgi:MoxR-like ATPase
MATQNPVEMDGTYPLPEAQLDRFLVRTHMGYPDHAAEVRVMVAEHSGAGVGDVPHVSDPDEIATLIAWAKGVHVAEPIFDYIATLVGHTRQMTQLRLGASPRGALGLLRASRVRAALSGRAFVVPSDIQSLAEPVLAHRMLVSSAFEASGGTSSDATREAVEAVAAPPGDGQR